MRRISALPLVCALALVPMGVAACGSSDDNAAIDAATKREHAIEQKLKRQEQQGLAKLRHAKRQAQKAKRRAERARQAAQPPAQTTTPTTPTTSTTPAPASNCDPNYTGACLQLNAIDYDCEGGSGDGPLYTGEVTVVGTDHYGLDANGNGLGCE